MVLSKENQGKLGTTRKLCTAQKMRFSIKNFFSKCDQSAIAKNQSLEGRLDNSLCLSNFEIFFLFPNFLRS